VATTSSGCTQYYANCDAISECVDINFDPLNCGGCGQPCSGTCIEGKCVDADADVLLTLPSYAVPVEPWSLKADGAFLYWGSGSTVYRVAKSGGAVETVASGVVGDPEGSLSPYFKVLEGYVFFWGPSGMMRVPVTGGTPERFTAAGGPTMDAGAVCAATGSYCQSFGATTLPASDGSFFYWLEYKIIASLDGFLSLQRTPVAGGPTKQLGSFGVDVTSGLWPASEIAVANHSILAQRPPGLFEAPQWDQPYYVIPIPPAGTQATSMQSVQGCGSPFIENTKTIFCGHRQPNGDSYAMFATGLDRTLSTRTDYRAGAGMSDGSPWPATATITPIIWDWNNIVAASDKNAYTAGGLRIPLCGGNTLGVYFGANGSAVAADGKSVFFVTGSQIRVLPDP
jgi:hypothetical protein